MRTGTPSDRAIPTRALGQRFEMMRVTQAALPRLTAPRLVIHARRDHTALFACAPRIAALASRTSDRRIVELHHSAHLIAIDVERDAVADRHTDASAPGDPPCAT